MPPVISIVGKSASGKTTLIEKLIPALQHRGYRVGVVKHAHHGFEMDRPGKDSHRHKQAGAHSVMVASSHRIALIKDTPGDHLDDLMNFFQDVDVLIAEGFKKDRAPKIEVFRAEHHHYPACLNDDTLIALVSDTIVDVAVPQFTTTDIESITDFIVSNLLPEQLKTRAN